MSVGLASLLASYPLPERYSEPELLIERFPVRAVPRHLVGISCSDGLGSVVFGSCCDTDLERAIRRAYFELLERFGILDAEKDESRRSWELRGPGGELRAVGRCEEVFPCSPKPGEWKYARSSGVAAHPDWGSACRSAALELVERDRVLRSWLGESTPARLRPKHRSELASQLSQYDLELYRFEAPGGFNAGIHVVGLFGFGRDAERPPVFGFGAGMDAQEALAHAEDELCQRAGFLWEEKPPEQAPDPAPSPAYHQEFYTSPGAEARLRAWLGGRRRGSIPSSELRVESICFVDLTPPQLKGRLSVVKAISPQAVRLRFGKWPENALEPHPFG